MRQWLKEEYPSISARAKAEKAETHWADETAVVNTDMRGRRDASQVNAPIHFLHGQYVERKRRLPHADIVIVVKAKDKRLGAAFATGEELPKTLHDIL